MKKEEVKMEGGRIFYQQLIYQAMAIVRNAESSAKINNLLREAATEYFDGVEVTIASFWGVTSVGGSNGDIF